MKRKGPYKFTCYVPPDKEQTAKDFLEIADREGSSGSEKVVEYMTRYVDAHKHGNPQMLIEKFMAPTWLICSDCGKKFKTLKRVLYISGKEGFLCEVDFKKRTKQTVIKKVFEVIGQK